MSRRNPEESDDEISDKHLFYFEDDEYQSDADQAKLLTNLRKKISDENINHILIYIHGYLGDRLASSYSKRFRQLFSESVFKTIKQSMFRKSVFLSRGMEMSPIQQSIETFNTQQGNNIAGTNDHKKALVIVYYWDCDNMPDTAHAKAQASSKILLKLLKDLHNDQTITKMVNEVDIVAHSFGNYVLVNCLGIFKVLGLNFLGHFKKIRQFVSLHAAIETTFLRDNASDILFDNNQDQKDNDDDDGSNSFKSWTFFWDKDDRVCKFWRVFNAIEDDTMVGNTDIITKSQDYFGTLTLNQAVIRSVNCSDVTYNFARNAWAVISR